MWYSACWVLLLLATMAHSHHDTRCVRSVAFIIEWSISFIFFNKTRNIFLSFTKKKILFLKHNFMLFQFSRIFHSFYWTNFNMDIGRKSVQYCQNGFVRTTFHNTVTRWRWKYLEMWRAVLYVYKCHTKLQYDQSWVSEKNQRLIIWRLC